MYNKTLNVWSLGKLVSFLFPGVLMFPRTKSWETSGLLEKQNSLFCSGPYIKYIILDGQCTLSFFGLLGY